MKLQLKFFFLWGDEKVLELDSSNGCLKIVEAVLLTLYKGETHLVLRPKFER